MKRNIAVSTFLHGISALGPQIIGLFALESADFGLFSAIYLMFALSLAINLSVLCDPWVMLYKKEATNPSLYCLILAVLALIFGTAGGLTAFLLGEDLVLALIAFLCVGFATFRAGARYYNVWSGSWARVIGGDATSIAGLIIGSSLAIFAAFEPIYIVLFAWLFSAFSACFYGPYFKGGSVKQLRWVRENRRIIRPLLIDSLAMEVSGVGTPYALLPVLGLQGFGVYRAISNLSAPVRLVFAPIRPLIVASPNRVLRGKLLSLILASSAVFSMLAWASLQVLQVFPVEFGVISEIAEFSVAAAIYVLGAVLLSIFPLVVRAQRQTGKIFLGRGVQTIAGIAFPLGGYFLFDLEGALWAFGLSSFISGVVWMFLALSTQKEQRL